MIKEQRKNEGSPDACLNNELKLTLLLYRDSRYLCYRALLHAPPDYTRSGMNLNRCIRTGQSGALRRREMQYFRSLLYRPTNKH